MHNHYCLSKFESKNVLNQILIFLKLMFVECTCISTFFGQKWNVHFMCRFPLDLFYSFPFIYTNRLSSEFSFLNLTLYKTDYWMNLWTHHWTYWEMLMAEWIKSIYWWKHSVFIDKVSILYDLYYDDVYVYM